MSSKTVAFIFRVISLVAILGASLYLSHAGEMVISQLRGRVLDQNRAAVVGARVTALRKGQPAASTVTNQNGEFSLLARTW